MELSSVDWSRAQFGLTALYHFLFVPLTLGLSFIIAFAETIYVKTGSEIWLKITKFWARLFAINFAIGVATGLIMEFEFGTNWANYSWFVGDIFGAPLAIEGLFAFFLESTFFAVMFFGWDKVSAKFHLFSTWCVAIGSNLSAFWILVANGWMQNPAGTTFNPATARNEMSSFIDVALNPVAISKFMHTTASGYIASALFVLGISAYFMLKNRHFEMAKRSFVLASSFGILSSLFVLFSGDEAAYQVAQKQPMKLAAMEGLYKGEINSEIVIFGILNPAKRPGDDNPPYLFKIAAPFALGLMATRGLNNFTPGIDDLVYGNATQKITPTIDKIASGKIALNALSAYKKAKDTFCLVVYTGLHQPTKHISNEAVKLISKLLKRKTFTLLNCDVATDYKDAKDIDYKRKEEFKSRLGEVCDNSYIIKQNSLYCNQTTLKGIDKILLYDKYKKQKKTAPEKQAKNIIFARTTLKSSPLPIK